MEMLAELFDIKKDPGEPRSVTTTSRTESDYDRGIRVLRVELQCCRRSKGFQSFTSGRVNYHESSDGAQFHLCFCFSDRLLALLISIILWARGTRRAA